MAISSQEYPGWQGNVGDKNAARIFGIDLNDRTGNLVWTAGSFLCLGLGLLLLRSHRRGN